MSRRGAKAFVDVSVSMDIFSDSVNGVSSAGNNLVMIFHTRIPWAST